MEEVQNWRIRQETAPGSGGSRSPQQLDACIAPLGGAEGGACISSAVNSTSTAWHGRCCCHQEGGEWVRAAGLEKVGKWLSNGHHKKGKASDTNAMERKTLTCHPFPTKETVNFLPWYKSFGINANFPPV